MEASGDGSEWRNSTYNVALYQTVRERTMEKGRRARTHQTQHMPAVAYRIGSAKYLICQFLHRKINSRQQSSLGLIWDFDFES